MQKVIQQPQLFTMIQGVPRVLGLKYTDTVAELKMDHCGESVQSFMNSAAYQHFPSFKKACIAFDMMR